MILIDVNLLIYATQPLATQHHAAKSWLDAQLASPVRVGLPWESLLAFVRITTNPRAFQVPASINDAWSCVQTWLSVAHVWIPQPTDRHVQVLEMLLKSPNVLPRHISDAQLAAIAIEHGLTLCSTDADFARFPGLQWKNPINP